MDLSFSRFEFDAPLTVLPADLAVMMVGIAARQASSPTAIAQSRLLSLPAVADLFAPLYGAFNARVAASLGAWREMKPVFTEPL